MAKDEKYEEAGRPRGMRGRAARDGGCGAGGMRGQSLSEEIIALDAELLRLLTRRSLLMGKLRKGRSHAFTPGIIKSEKQIRGAWEQAAGRLSGGTRLARQLFSLISELEINPERDKEGYSPFNLSPARQPVDVDAPGQASTVLTQLCFSLAAASGLRLSLLGAPRSAPLLEMLRAFAQTGVQAEWREENLALEGGQRPDYHGKAIFLGDDALTFYLFAFLGAPYPGKMRFTGGPGLKEADILGILGHLMPSLGARLIPLLPGSRGLPVNLECSGELPDELILPEALPDPAVLAILAAALTWRRKISISLSAQPPERQRRLLELARRFFKAAPGAGRIRESCIDYTGSAVADLGLPDAFRPPLDPALAAGMLALPIFAGGGVKLSGKWLDTYEYEELINLFMIFSLEVTYDEQGVRSRLGPGGIWPDALELEELSARLHPLFWVLNARLAGRAKGRILIRRWPSGADLDLAAEFMTQIGYRLAKSPEGLALEPLPPDEFKESASKTYGWPCPSFGWGVAMSLAAFTRSNLKISNPECVSRVQPDYWSFYNRLPAPRMLKTPGAQPLPQAPQAAPERSGRRRIRTGSLAEPTPREDFEERG